MVGENFEMYSSQITKNTFKLSTMVGGNFEICMYEMARNAFKLSTLKLTENKKLYQGGKAICRTFVGHMAKMDPNVGHCRTCRTNS